MPPLDLEQLNQLLRRLKTGDPCALDGILALVGRRMLALSRGIVGNAADAEDVLQESFLKIARGIHGYQDGTNSYGWIMRIVRNTALDFLRRNKRIASENLDEFFHLTDERYSPERREEAFLLEEAVNRLEPMQKRLIYYRYYLDFTIREIAAETGLSKSAVQRALAATEEKLKKLMGIGTN